MKLHGRVLRRFLLAGIGALCVSLRAAWEPITCPRADPAPRDRVQPVTVINSFENDTGSWQAYGGGQHARSEMVLDTTEAAVGNGSLRVDCEFTGKLPLEYVEFGPHRTIEKPGLGIGFWVRAEGIRPRLRLRIIDASGETHQINLPRPRSEDDPEWRYTAVMLAAKAASWGGDGNHRLDYPCTFHSIVSDRPAKGYTGKGSIWIDQIAEVEPVKPTNGMSLSVADKRLGNLYEPGERIRLRCTVPEGGVAWAVRDYAGVTRWQGTTDPKNGLIEFGPLPQGWYECIMTWKPDDAPAETRIFRCAALPRMDGVPANSFVGFCTHFQRHQSWPAEGMDLFRRYGFTMLRDEIPWGAVETSKGDLQLPEDRARFVFRAAELGLDPLLICCYGNPFHDDGGFPNSPEAREAYARYCAFMVKNLGKHVRQWEIWNEWTVKCGMRDKPGSNAPQHYAAMLTEAYNAVKAVDPVVTVVGIGGEHSGHHLENLKAMMESGDAAEAMDAFSVHSYRYPRSPEETDLYGEIQRVAAAAVERGAPSRVWVTEIGWPTHTGPRGIDERQQAPLFVRTMAMLQATGVVDRTYWYDFKDDGLKRDYNENNFGVVNHQKLNWAPKPTAVAAAVFARMTADARCEGLKQMGDVYAVTYRQHDGSDLCVLWSTKPDQPIAVKGDVSQCLDLMGTPLHAIPQTVGPNPIYLRGNNLDVTTSTQPAGM